MPSGRRRSKPSVPPGMEEFKDASGRTWCVHAREKCSGTCTLHNPSDHPLNKAPILFRDGDLFDLKPRGFAERLCEHGVGHSDPDSVAFFASKGIEGLGIHGCDGCCSDLPF